jgi:hypothetical protein
LASGRLHFSRRFLATSIQIGVPSIFKSTSLDTVDAYRRPLQTNREEDAASLFFAPQPLAS